MMNMLNVAIIKKKRYSPIISSIICWDKSSSSSKSDKHNIHTTFSDKDINNDLCKFTISDTFLGAIYQRDQGKRSKQCFLSGGERGGGWVDLCWKYVCVAFPSFRHIHSKVAKRNL